MRAKKGGTTSRCQNAKTKTVLESGCKKVSKNSNSTYSLHILAISSWPSVHRIYRLRYGDRNNFCVLELALNIFSSDWFLTKIHFE